MTGKYTKSEKFLQAKENKILHIEGINEEYWNDFELNSGKPRTSINQYRSAVRRYIEAINKDVLESTIEDLNIYLENFEEGKTRTNHQRYIQGFLAYAISNNYKKGITNVSSELILSLIPQDYKNLVSVLINK
jgi:hypothetical protein